MPITFLLLASLKFGNGFLKSVPDDYEREGIGREPRDKST
jgi:hypothetical protein